MRGPAPTPTRLRILKGETKPSRVNRKEPQPRDAPPRMPPGMTPAAKAVWRRVIRDFGATKVIRAADASILRLHCDAVARYEEYAALLATSGPLIRGARGRELVRNPLQTMLRQEAELAKTTADALGLTPSARTRLAAPEERESDAFGDWERGDA